MSAGRHLKCTTTTKKHSGNMGQTEGGNKEQLLNENWTGEM